VTFDIWTDVDRVNGVGDPLLFRIGLAGLFAQYGTEPVRRRLIEEAARAGDNVVSIATALDWQPPVSMAARK
jgi:hypothetical protein